jgi:beta-lactamase superfamily II metal-dependent hydrolase
MPELADNSVHVKLQLQALQFLVGRLETFIDVGQGDSIYIVSNPRR